MDLGIALILINIKQGELVSPRGLEPRARP